MAGRQAAEPFAPAGAGQLPPSSHDVSSALAGGVVDLCHGGQSGAAHHVRLSESKPELVHAVALLFASERAGEDSEAGQIPHSAEPPDCGDAAQEQDILADPGQQQIVSTILRVPITFPPEKFNGRMLSAMCTPDLLGTQGTFALYTTRTHGGEMESGNRFPLVRDEALYRGRFKGRSTRCTRRQDPWKSRSHCRAEREGRRAVRDRRRASSPDSGASTRNGSR